MDIDVGPWVWGAGLEVEGSCFRVCAGGDCLICTGDLGQLKISGLHEIVKPEVAGE